MLYDEGTRTHITGQPFGRKLELTLKTANCNKSKCLKTWRLFARTDCQEHIGQVEDEEIRVQIKNDGLILVPKQIESVLSPDHTEPVLKQQHLEIPSLQFRDESSLCSASKQVLHSNSRDSNVSNDNDCDDVTMDSNGMDYMDNDKYTVIDFNAVSNSSIQSRPTLIPCPSSMTSNDSNESNHDTLPPPIRVNAVSFASSPSPQSPVLDPIEESQTAEDMDPGPFSPPSLLNLARSKSISRRKQKLPRTYSYLYKNGNLMMKVELPEGIQIAIMCIY